MTPQEKVNGLIDKMKLVVKDETTAINVALIAVKEVITEWEYVDAYLANAGGEFNRSLYFWYRVEIELNKMLNRQ